MGAVSRVETENEIAQVVFIKAVVQFLQVNNITLP